MLCHAFDVLGSTMQICNSENKRKAGGKLFLLHRKKITCQICVFGGIRILLRSGMDVLKNVIDFTNKAFTKANKSIT